jgi:hypothetical protein
MNRKERRESLKVCVCAAMQTRGRERERESNRGRMKERGGIFVLTAATQISSIRLDHYLYS